MIHDAPVEAIQDFAVEYIIAILGSKGKLSPSYYLFDSSSSFDPRFLFSLGVGKSAIMYRLFQQTTPLPPYEPTICDTYKVQHGKVHTQSNFSWLGVMSIPRFLTFHFIFQIFK